MLVALQRQGGKRGGISTPVHRAWKATRGHNYYDCAGMRAVTRKAAKGLTA